jgi:hypothetical protein
MRKISTVAVLGLAVLGMTSAASAVILAEVEPNNSGTTAATAQITAANTAGVFALADGDQITGNASSTDPDYFRIRSSRAVDGSIVRHSLTSSTSSIALSARGVNNGFTAGDVNITDSFSSTGGRQTIKWYSLGNPVDMYVRANRSSTATNYTLTMTTSTITPVNVGTFGGGSLAVDIKANLVGDSELFLYDSNFNVVSQSDDFIGDNRARILRTLGVGTYYLAVGSGQTASTKAFDTLDTASPFYSSAAPAMINPIVISGSPTNIYGLIRPENLVRSSTDFGINFNGTSVIYGGFTNSLEVAWYSFTVIPEPSALGLLAPATLVLGRRRKA